MIRGSVGVTCERVRVAFFREIMTFCLVEVGSGCKCRSNRGLRGEDEEIQWIRCNRHASNRLK